MIDMTVFTVVSNPYMTKNIWFKCYHKVKSLLICSISICSFLHCIHIETKTICRIQYCTHLDKQYICMNCRGLSESTKYTNKKTNVLNIPEPNKNILQLKLRHWIVVGSVNQCNKCGNGFAIAHCGGKPFPWQKTWWLWLIGSIL